MLLGRAPCAARAALAHRMGLPHLTLDLRDEFRAGVVEPWLADHAAGLTPNPCVRCNGNVRLDAMLDARRPRSAPRTLATGHYARVARDDGLLRLRRRPGQGPDLHARRAAAARRSRGCASRSAS